MKLLLTILLLLQVLVGYPQRYSDSVWGIRPCPIDTIKGVIFLTPDYNTQSVPEDGYFIAKCGGYQIGNFFGYQDVPTFIPAYFIRNDNLVNGVQQVRHYQRQKQTGYFTDENFRILPYESIYGMLVIKRDSAEVGRLKEVTEALERAIKHTK